MTRRLLAATALALILAEGSHGQSADPDLPGRMAVATKIYSLVQQYFAHWEGAPPSDVETAYQKYLADVPAAADRKGFDLATLRFIASLHNGHTQFSDDQADGRPLKFRLLEVDQRWVVISSQESTLSPGAIVRTIDGRPAGDVVGELAQYVAASNDRLARTHVFSYPMLFPERVSLGLEDGRVVVVDRTVKASTAPAVARESTGRWLREGETAYIRVPSFGDPAFERTAVDLVRQFTTAPNLIVDVRGNGGGTTPRQLIDALMNRPWRTWQQSTRPSLEQSPLATAYPGRVFILVNRFCGSACEDFVMPFKETGRGVVIGETTQGSSGNPYRTDLGNGFRVAIGAVRYRFPDGRPFEGTGIAPDVPIDWSITDLHNNRDTALEHAQKLAGQR